MKYIHPQNTGEVNTHMNTHTQPDTKYITHILGSENILDLSLALIISHEVKVLLRGQHQFSFKNVCLD